MNLSPTETEVTDQARIGWLVANGLEKVAAGNWKALYRDPADGRFWEITYPHSERHGGGPALMTVISSDDAKATYSL